MQSDDTTRLYEAEVNLIEYVVDPRRARLFEAAIRRYWW